MKLLLDLDGENKTKVVTINKNKEKKMLGNLKQYFDIYNNLLNLWSPYTTNPYKMAKKCLFTKCSYPYPQGNIAASVNLGDLTYKISKDEENKCENLESLEKLGFKKEEEIPEKEKFNNLIEVLNKLKEEE